MHIVFDNVTKVTQQMLNQLLEDTAKFVNELPDHVVRHTKDLPGAVIKEGPRIRNGDAFLCLVPKLTGPKQQVRIAWYMESPKDVDMGPPGSLDLGDLNRSWEKLCAPRPRDVLQLAFEGLRSHSEPKLDIKAAVKQFMEPKKAVIHATPADIRKSSFHPDRPRIAVDGDLSPEQFQMLAPGDFAGVPCVRQYNRGYTSRGQVRRPQSAEVIVKPVFVCGPCMLSVGRIQSLPLSGRDGFGYVIVGPLGRLQLARGSVDLPRLNFLWEVFRSESAALSTPKPSSAEVVTEAAERVAE